MPVFNVSGMGAVRLPEGLSAEDYERIVRRLQEKSGAAAEGTPDYSAGQVAAMAVQRGLGGLGISSLYEFPALALTGVEKLTGSEAAGRGAESLLSKAREATQYMGEMAPRRFESYEKPQGIGEGLLFGLERFSEAVPSIGTSMIGGGIPALLGRGAAQRAGVAAAEKALAGGAAKEAAEELGQTAAQRLLQRRAFAGSSGVMFPAQAAEPFVSIYERTGEREFAAPVVAGAVSTLLEGVVPTSVLGNLGAFGKLKASERLLDKAGFGKAAADISLRAAGVGAAEGLTETAQQAITNLAIQSADQTFDAFGPERTKEYIEAAISGFLGGAPIGAGGAAIRRMRIPRDTSKEEAAVQRLQELAGVKPPETTEEAAPQQGAVIPVGQQGVTPPPPQEFKVPVAPTTVTPPVVPTPPVTQEVKPIEVKPQEAPPPIKPPRVLPGQELKSSNIRYMGQDVSVSYRALPDGRVARFIQWPDGDMQQTFLSENEEGDTKFFSTEVAQKEKYGLARFKPEQQLTAIDKDINRYDEATGKTFKDELEIQEPKGQGLIRQAKDLDLDFVHGTTLDKKQELLRTGKFAPVGQDRSYSYSQFGNQAVYFAPPGSWWLNKDRAEAGRAAVYPERVQVDIDPTASIAVIDSIEALNALAKMANYKRGSDLMRDLDTENLDYERQIAEARKQTLPQFIRSHVNREKEYLIQMRAREMRADPEAMKQELAAINSIKTAAELSAYKNSKRDVDEQTSPAEYLSNLAEEYKSLRSNETRQFFERPERATKRLREAGVDGIYVTRGVSREIARKVDTSAEAKRLYSGLEPAYEQLAMFNMDKVKPRREEGMIAPPKFVEPSPEFGKPAVTEASMLEEELVEMQKLVEKLESQAEKEQSLWSVLRGKLDAQEVKDISPELEYRFLIAPEGRGVVVADLIEDGALDAWLDEGMRGEVLDSDVVKEATEAIKEKLRQKDYMTVAAKNEIAQMRREADQFEADIQELLTEEEALKEINNALAEAQEREIDETTGEPVAVDASRAFEAGVSEREAERGQDFLLQVLPEGEQAVSVKRAVRKALKDYKRQGVSAEAAMTQIDEAFDRAEAQRKQKEDKLRQRGLAYIRERLANAVRNNYIDEDSAEFAEWFIQRNPSLFNDLAVSIRKAPEAGPLSSAAGGYSALQRLMVLFKGKVNDTTIVHEMLHHLERLMPADIQSAILRTWAKSLAKEAKLATDPQEKKFFDLLMTYHFGGPLLEGVDATKEAAVEMIANGSVGYDLYQYTDASEFWAVNASEIMRGQFDMKPGIISKLKKWLADVAEYIKDFFNLPSRAPILRALKSLSKADGEYQSLYMLNKGPQPVLGEDFVAKPEQEEDFRMQMAKASDLLDGSPRDVDRGLRTMIESAPRIDQGLTKVRQAVGDFTSDNSSMLLSFLNLRQLGKAAGKVLPQMMDYYRKTSEMLTFRDNRLVRAAQLVERWDKWANESPAEGKALSTVLLKARLTGLRPTRDEDLKRITDQEFLNAWNKIKGTEGAQIFKEIDRFFRTSAQLYFNALGKRIRNSIENKQARRLAFDLIKAEYNKFKQGGFYFPFARFGDYWVSFKYLNNTPAYYMFESQADQRNFIEKNVTPRLQSNEIKDFKSGTKTSQMMSDGVAMSEFITKLMDIVDNDVQMTVFDDAGGNTTAKSKLKDDIWQLYLTMGPDLSVQKHFIHAKKVEGYSVDALRAFSESAFHGTYHLARITYGGDLDRIVLDARNLQNNEPSNERGRFLEELQRHHMDFSSPQGGNQYVSALTNFGFMFYLSAPASAIVNISQVPIVAAPYMASFFKKSHLYTLRKLGAAASEFLASRKGTTFDLPAYLLEQSKNKAISTEERARYKSEYEAINRLLGTLNRTQTLSLAGIAERPSALFATGIKGAMRTKALTKYQKVRIALGYMFNQAELFNRQVTALAAYRMALEATNRDGSLKYNKDTAVEVARDVVDETHFEYAAETKARFMRGPVGQLVFQFMNYSQQMTALLATSLKHAVYMDKNELARLEAIAADKNKSEAERKEAREAIEDMKDIQREARKRLAGIMFMTGVFSGYEGLPFVFWAIESVMNAFFGDDDEPYNFRLEAKQGLAELFGDNVARMFSTGIISEITQMDWASRTSLNGLWFRENVTSKDEAEWLRNQLVDALGPAVGMFVGVAEGLKKINDGYTMRGIETMLPPIIKDGFKSYRYATEGATTLRGDPIVADVGIHGILVQLLGFTPQEVARAQEARGEILSIVGQLDRKRSNLMNRLWIAHRTGDTSAYDEIGEEIIEFNSKNPNEEISEETIRRSFAQRQRISDRAVQGLSLPERRQYLLEKIEYANPED